MKDVNTRKANWTKSSPTEIQDCVRYPEHDISYYVKTATKHTYLLQKSFYIAKKQITIF